MPEKDLLLSELAQGKEGDKTILAYLLAKEKGEEDAEMFLYMPRIERVLENIAKKIGEMGIEQRGKLLAALVLERIGESQTGKFKDAMLLTAHTEIKKLLESVSVEEEETAEEQKKKAEAKSKTRATQPTAKLRTV